MLAQLLAGRGIAQGGVRVHQEREFGPLDQPLLAGRPAHQLLQGRDHRGPHLGMVGGVRGWHRIPPSPLPYTALPTLHKLMKWTT